MTPKEKAKELFDKFLMEIPNNEMSLEYEASRQCALIAVDEILDAIVIINEHNFDVLNKYWAEVKQEIENL
jgi:hypothetical protein